MAKLVATIFLLGPVCLVLAQDFIDPCNPSPCGVNTRCEISTSHRHSKDTRAGICRCLDGWDHAPGSNTIEGCPIRAASKRPPPPVVSRPSVPRSRPRVIGNRLGNNRIGVLRGNEDRRPFSGDPCSPNPCGENTDCTAQRNRAICSCLPDHVGDPYTRCEPNPCSRNPCGIDAECINRNGRAECRCPPGYEGDPYTRCDDNPCNQNPSPCARNADCQARNRQAICTCREGYEGDPFSECRLNPCLTNPCGINAECENNNGVARCTCNRGYEGDAYRRCNLNPCFDDPCGPNAQCEAQGNSARCSCLPGYVGEPTSRTGCVLEPCSQDPCGIDAECESRGRSAVCRCPRGFTGDPYTRCRADPCLDEPCGNNAICENSGNGGYTCTCPENFVGSAYENCVFDPCAGNPCGPNTECTVSGDRAICRCQRGYVGSPESRSGCRADPCSVADSCGRNAECRNEADRRSGSQRPTCYCLSGHVGNPYDECFRGECIGNSDCSPSQACQDYQCVDPCQTSCGSGADCDVRDHVAICRCPRGFTGDPFQNCRRFTRDEICEACGANTDCEVGPDDRPICRCKKNYIGDPLTACRYECERDSECSPSQKCENFRCVAVCDQDACGENANCVARNNRAVCTCPEDFLGDGYSRRGCYTECIRHTDCSSEQACIKFKCVDPCYVPEKICGEGADCYVRNNKPICSCPRSHTGDPFVRCRPFTREDLCTPNPCGQNAQCQPGYGRNNEDTPVCNCLPGYRGDPIRGCQRGDCDNDNDCRNDQTCSNFRCEDPCRRDACGVSADCRARNHAAVCTCPSNYVGDPLVACRPVRDGARTRIIGQTRRRYKRALDYISSFFF